MSEPLSENQPIAPEPPAPEPEVQYAQIPQEEYEQLKQLAEMAPQLAPLAEYVQQLPAEGYEQQQPQTQAEVDFFGDNPTEQIRQLIREEMAPIAEVTQKQQQAEMGERAKDILSDYAAEKGFEFMDEASADRALILANHYVAEEAERYGMGAEAAEAAIARAADDVRAWEEAVGKAYSERQTNEIRTITGAPRQPDAPTAPQALPSIAAPTGGPHAVLQKYFPGA